MVVGQDNGQRGLVPSQLCTGKTVCVMCVFSSSSALGHANEMFPAVQLIARSQNVMDLKILHSNL